MSISLDTVRRTAHLARISLTNDQGQLVKLQKDLSGILDWVHQLSEVNTHGIEPLINPSQAFIDETPVRLDTITDGNKVQDILSNAPEKAHDMFVVPKVIE